MEESLRLRTHDSMKNGNDYKLDSLIDEFLPKKKREGSFVATDMDGTLFDADLGRLAFLEKLSMPKDWQFTPNYFNRLLIPQRYQEVIASGARGLVNGLNNNECRRVMDLKEDVVELYGHMYKMKVSQEVTVSHPLANEFARKMLELDHLLMVMDAVLLKWFDGMLLMRTRFYAGQNKKHVAHLTKQVMERKNHGKGNIKLKVHPHNRNKYTEQRVRAKDFGQDNIMSIDRVVNAIPGSREIIFKLLSAGMPVRVITTNLKQIALTALENSDYNGLLYQYCAGKKPIVASTLEHSDDGKYGPLPDKLPVFGDVKKRILSELQSKMKKKVMCALGDSPRNDTPMGHISFRNNGVFVAVGDEYEQTHKRFQPFYDEMCDKHGDQDDIENRIWYVTKD